MGTFGLTQVQMGNLIGIRHAAVSHWLTGRSEMPQSTAMAYQSALGIRWQWLLHGEGAMLLEAVTQHFPDDLKELAELWPRLSVEDRQYVLGVAEGRAAKGKK